MKRCSRCGEEKPLSDFHRFKHSKDGHKPDCKTCRIALERSRWQNNAETHSLRRRSDRQSRLGEMRALDRARQSKRRAQRSAYARAVNAANPEANRERANAWYAANRARAVQRALAWQRDNPELANDRNQRRRARVRNAPVVEKIDRTSIIERDKGVCQICGLPVPPQERHLDHIIPLFLGGMHTADNLRLTHRHCNLSRRLSDYSEKSRLKT